MPKAGALFRSTPTANWNGLSTEFSRQVCLPTRESWMTMKFGRSSLMFVAFHRRAVWESEPCTALEATC